MELRQLVYFAKIVEEGSISSAARALYMTQPPLSLQIKHLEEELQTPLFKRQGQQLVVTEAGEALYQRALDILRLVDVAKRDVHAITNDARETLRIGVTTSSCTAYARNVIKRFHAQHPNIRYDLLERNSYELTEMLTKKQLDLAMVRIPFPEVAAKRLLIQKDSLVATGYPSFFQHSGPVSLKDLQAMPLLIYRRWENILREAFEQQGLSFSPLMISDDARTCFRWARSGFGVALTPHPVQDSLDPYGLACREIEDIVLDSSVFLLMNDIPFSRLSLEFFEFFQDCTKNDARPPAGIPFDQDYSPQAPDAP